MVIVFGLIAGKTTSTLSMNKSFRQLLDLMPTRLIVPLQHQLTATLPSSGLSDPSHHPFPEQCVTISDFYDKVQPPTPKGIHDFLTIIIILGRDNELSPKAQENYDAGIIWGCILVPMQT